jgi:hypothetical protein
VNAKKELLLCQLYKDRYGTIRYEESMVIELFLMIVSQTLLLQRSNDQHLEDGGSEETHPQSLVSEIGGKWN